MGRRPDLARARPTAGIRPRSSPGVAEDDILGVAAPIWTETIATTVDLEFMVFPRLAAIAEIAWSPAPGDGAARDTEEFLARVARFGDLLDAMDVAYHRVPEVAWTE